MRTPNIGHPGLIKSARSEHFRILVIVLAALLGFTAFGISSPVHAQAKVYDLDEINGDVRILGDERYDKLGAKDSVAVFDFNDNGLNDLLLIRGNYGSIYGFFDFDFEQPNTFIDTREIKPDLYMPYNINAHFAFDRLITADLNGDGADDLITSSIDSFTSSGDSSKVFIINGSAAWPPGTTIDLTTDSADLTILYGYPEYVYFGNTMVGGDINHDGIDDLIIGAFNAENPEGFFKGAVYVVFGSTDFPPQATLDFSQTPADLTFYGGGGDDDFGYDVASGDVNGDGIDDVIVGALKGELDDLGRIYVFYGSDAFPPHHTVDLTYGSADITVIGPSYYSYLGRSVACGDFNGDGIDDFCGGGDDIVSSDGQKTGATYLFYGRSDYPPEAVINLALQPADIICFGDMEESNLGAEMKIDDLDGDGFNDWAISALQSQQEHNWEGLVYLLQGSNEYSSGCIIDFAKQPSTSMVLGDDASDYLSLCGEMTDVNQDGLADLVLGAYNATREDTKRCGEAYIILSRGPLNTPPRFVAGPGPAAGNGVEVRLFDPRLTNNWWSRFEPYGLSGYGANVAAGDLDGDGYDEVITGPGPGTAHPPQVAGFAPGGDRLFDYLAYGAPKYGVRVAAGDIDGDGIDEIVTGAGPGSVYGPHVRGWRWKGGAFVTPLPGFSYLAYGTHRWGVNVAAGDIDGDGREEIITGAGPGDVFGPHVRGWQYDGVSSRPIQAVSFFAYGTLKWGVNVACGDIDGDGIDEMITGPGPGAVFGSHVRAFDYDGEQVAGMPGVSFFAYPSLGSGFGAVVACGDVDNDRVAEIITAPGPCPGYPPWLKTWNYDGNALTLVENKSFMVFEKGEFTSGAELAFGNFYQDPPYLP